MSTLQIEDRRIVSDQRVTDLYETDLDRAGP